jgi:hypothetical protein
MVESEAVVALIALNIQDRADADGSARIRLVPPSGLGAATVISRFPILVDDSRNEEIKASVPPHVRSEQHRSYGCGASTIRCA